MNWIGRLGAGLSALRGHSGRETQLRLDTALLFILTHPTYANEIEQDRVLMTLDKMPPFGDQLKHVVKHVSEVATHSLSQLNAEFEKQAKISKGNVLSENPSQGGRVHQESAFSVRRMAFAGNRHIPERTFSLRVASSLIPGAGLGLFVDGEAPAGSLITIYPGITYRPSDVKHMADFPIVSKNNEHLLWRYDGVIVDGGPGAISQLLRRKRLESEIPFEQSHLNTYAGGQYINHPPRGTVPNALQYALDIRLARLPARVKHLVPNLPWEAEPHGAEGPVENPDARLGDWKKRFLAHSLENLENMAIRQRVISSALISRRAHNPSTTQKSIAIMATRPVVNEEVYINYRFNPDGPDLPDWYADCNPEESRRRWAQEGFWK
jgi:hypothetical protein